MSPQEIQDIKDQAAREVCCHESESFSNILGDVATGFISTNTLEKIIDRAIELAAKREIKVPSEGEINDKFILSEEIDGSNWAIRRIKEMNS